MRLRNKTAIVTGGGAGIGRATVELFAREGAQVVIAEFNEESGRAALEAVKAAGGEAIYVQTDVSKEDQMQALIDAAIRTYGKIDVLHNNVGGSRVTDGKITEISNEEFWFKINVDLFGTWLGCRLAIPHMIKNGGGSIINMTSIHGLVGVKGRNAYATAKGGIISLTRTLAVEFAEHMVRVNAVAPGGTLTERVLARSSGPVKPSGSRADHLLGLSEPIDIAYAVLYLASDESRTTTGQIMAADSGYTAH